jgi:hypothetical protein
MRLLALATMLLLARAAAAADDVVQWSDAEQHVGQATTVEGRVLGIHCSPTSCLLAFDPTFNRFTAVVQAKDFKTLPPETLDANYVGRPVRVRGTIQLLDKKPEIVVEKPEDLELVVTPKDRAAKREEQANDVVDRLDQILDRLDDMVDRLDATQAQLAQLTAVMDQQNQQIAALQAAMGATQSVEPGPEPSWGVAQPRPGYEALRTVKRGMTSQEVQRLVGEPNNVVTTGSGSSIWDYGYGRTITFDRRNRATGLVGFPAP